MSHGLGLLRDAVAAGLGLLILFGVDFSDEQVAGLLLFFTTAAAFGSYLFERSRGSRAE